MEEGPLERSVEADFGAKCQEKSQQKVKEKVVENKLLSKVAETSDIGLKSNSSKNNKQSVTSLKKGQSKKNSMKNKENKHSVLLNGPCSKKVTESTNAKVLEK